MLIQALQTEGDLDVLSSPHLLTSDNEEAEILVGENIPLRSGTTPALPAGAMAGGAAAGAPGGES